MHRKAGTQSSHCVPEEKSTSDPDTLRAQQKRAALEGFLGGWRLSRLYSGFETQTQVRCWRCRSSLGNAPVFWNGGRILDLSRIFARHGMPPDLLRKHVERSVTLQQMKAIAIAPSILLRKNMCIHFFTAPLSIARWCTAGTSRKMPE